MAKNEQLAAGSRVAFVGLTVNVLLTIFKFWAGFLAQSSAMISDATHSASDIGATLTVYLGIRLASRPADETHHYGHNRLESVAAKIVALILMVTGLTLGWEAWQLLRSGEIPEPGAIALWAAAISIVSKELLYRYVHGIGKAINSTAIRAEALHHRSDAFSSVAALLGIGGARLGITILEPIASLFVAGLIFRMGFMIYWRSIEELVDRAPDKETVKDIAQLALLTQGVQAVNDVKARLHASEILVDLKICVNPFITVQEGHEIGQAAEGNIMAKHEDVADVMVHVNPCRHMPTVDSVPDCENCSKG